MYRFCGEVKCRASRFIRRGLKLSSVLRSLSASAVECSKAVLPLMGASKAALRCRSQRATVGAWFKSARQSGSSVGLRVFAT